MENLIATQIRQRKNVILCLSTITKSMDKCKSMISNQFTKETEARLDSIIKRTYFDLAKCAESLRSAQSELQAQIEKEENRCTCDDDSNEYFACPYKIDVDGISAREAMCNCCPSCRETCADEI